MTKGNTNICKGIAIILMYFHHLFYLQEIFVGYEIKSIFLTADQLIKLALTCKICVAVFVFLAGYGTAKQYMIKSINNKLQNQQYTITRYMKLMWGFWFIFFFSQCLSFLGRSRIEAYGENILMRIVYLVIDFLGLAFIFQTPTFNPTWWYMSYAIFLIFFIPLILDLINSLGAIIVVPLSILLPLFIGLNTDTVFFTYMLTLILGIVFAQNNIYENISDLLPKSFFYKIVNIFISILLFIGLIKLRENIGYIWFTDALISIVVCHICIIFISKIKILNSILEFIGIHSMNLFMMHTFVFYYFFKEFTYSWKYPSLILIVLIITTVCISVVLENIKKVMHFNSLVEKSTQKIILGICKNE